MNTKCRTSSLVSRVNGTAAPVVLAYLACLASPALVAQFNYPHEPLNAVQSPVINVDLVEYHFNPANSHAYFRSVTPVTKSAAAILAQRAGGTLACIGDAAENAWIVSNYGSTRFFWIGLSDEGHENRFVWETGEPLAYTNWGTPREPNNGICATCTENDVVFNQHIPGGWNDMNRITAGPFYALVEVPAHRVCVYSRLNRPTGACGLVFGHAFLGLIDGTNQQAPYHETVQGFRPNDGSPWYDLSGCVSDDSREGWTCRLCYAVGADQWNNLVASIQADSGCPSHRNYDVRFMNCVDWVAEKLYAAGIRPPPYSFGGMSSPDILVASIVSLGGDVSGRAGLEVDPLSVTYFDLVSSILSRQVCQLAKEWALVISTGTLLPVQLGANAILKIALKTTDSPVTIVSAVDWGDGSTSYEPPFLHNYSASGNYTASCFVMDSTTLTEYRLPVAVGNGGPVDVMLQNPTNPQRPWQNRPLSAAKSNKSVGAIDYIGGGCSGPLRIAISVPVINRALMLTLSNDESSPVSTALAIGTEQPPVLISPGCSIYVWPLVLIASTMNAHSLKEFGVPVPNSQALIGAHFASQAISIKQGGLISASLALRATIGG